MIAAVVAFALLVVPESALLARQSPRERLVYACADLHLVGLLCNLDDACWRVAASRAAQRPAGVAALFGMTRMPAQLPDDLWEKIIEMAIPSDGLYAAKQLNKLADLSTVFARAARAHPDNHVPTWSD